MKFNLYNDNDLPFLDPSKEASNIIRGNIIDGDADDDCQTDDEQQTDAKGMMMEDLKNAIGKFI